MFHVYRREMLKLFMIITRTVLQCFIYGHFFFTEYLKKLNVTYCIQNVLYSIEIICHVQYSTWWIVIKKKPILQIRMGLIDNDKGVVVNSAICGWLESVFLKSWCIASAHNVVHSKASYVYMPCQWLYWYTYWSL